MPSEKVQETLLAIYPQLTGQLGQSLEARMKERKAAIYRTLTARAEKETKDITAILTELKAAIEKELNDPEYRQLELFSDPEKEQFERNKDALRARVKEIPLEIEHEVESIKSRFADPQVRLFPVAVTFLVLKQVTPDRLFCVYFLFSRRAAANDASDSLELRQVENSASRRLQQLGCGEA